MPTAKVQDSIAHLALSQYNLPIGVSIIPAGQSWQDRQKIQYEAMKGLMHQDFHSVADFSEQMELFSRGNYMMAGPWKAVRPLVSRKRKILSTLVFMKSLGLVGRFLTKIVGFEKTFVLPNEILEDSSSLKSRLGG